MPSKTGMIFKFNLPKDTSKLFLTTCHRKIEINKPDTPYEFQYLMRNFLENTGSCLLKAEALLSDGTVKKALVDFVDKETMVGFSSCNGSTVQSTGASLCQAPVSLKQMIQVSGDVDVVGLDKCAPLTCNGIWCFYNISKGFCVYRIVDLKTRLAHRLTTYGY